MRKRSKLLLGALVTTIALGALVSTTTAARFAFSNQSFRAVWTSLEFATSLGAVKCPVTVEGSFHSKTIAKVLESLIGYVTRGAVGACNGGTVTLQGETLPWHIRYNGFTGTLPINITEINVRLLETGYLMKIETGFGAAECLYKATAANPIRLQIFRETAFRATGLSPELSAQIKLFARLAGSLLACPAEHSFSESEAAFRVLGMTTFITVTLVM